MAPPAPLRRPGARRTRRLRGGFPGRRPRRGISEIIATIYVLAITVSLAAVFFSEVTALTRNGASRPYEVGIVFSTQAHGATTYFDVGTLVATAGLTTSMFGLKILAPGGETYPTASAVPGTCAYGASTPTPATCPGVSGGWYGILVSGASGNVTATYSGVGWTYAGGTTNVALDRGFSLIVVTSSPVAGSDDVLSAFGTGTSAVSGSVSL